MTALLLLLLAVPAAHAQDAAAERAATERRLRELRQQIEESNYRLEETREEEQASLQTLQNLDREIAIREELIKTYQRRLAQLSQENLEITASLQALEAEIEQLRRQYQGRAAHAYKYGRMHAVALILAAESINQMLIRARYLRRFAEERRSKLQEIQQAGRQLQAQREQLEATENQTRELLRAAEEEKRNLSQLRQERQRVVANLRRQRSSLEQEIQQTRAALSELEQQMARLAAEVSRRNNTADAATRAEYLELTGSFRQNKGRLPWPSDGVVTEPFGDLVNPVYGTRTPNPGILIATRPNAQVRAVFDGQVVQVSVIPDFGTYVAIEHGEYLTVYSNFSLLYVTEGDRVRAGQIIGLAGTDNEPRGSGIFFALFQSDQGAVDPRPWLRPQ
ncbi:MAG: peptidase M23 [Bacteroidetes bacterium]|nr:peptidase M23 [Rhodothermaceae bacterium RA]RMH55367.1 MAG: peptidase M23 [Bacteroidota bacterium]